MPISLDISVYVLWVTCHAPLGSPRERKFVLRHLEVGRADPKEGMHQGHVDTVFEKRPARLRRATRGTLQALLSRELRRIDKPVIFVPRAEECYVAAADFGRSYHKKHDQQRRDDEGQPDSHGTRRLEKTKDSKHAKTDHAGP